MVNITLHLVTSIPFNKVQKYEKKSTYTKKSARKDAFF